MVASRRRSSARRRHRCLHLHRNRQIHSTGQASNGQQSLEVTNWNEEKNAEARKAIAKFWYYSNIPFHVAKSPYYEEMLNALTGGDLGFKPPTYDDLRGPLLVQCVQDVHLLIGEEKKIWVREGCTIIFDGWTNEKGQTFINFLVASARSLVFLKSLDASKKVKNGRTLFTLLEDAVLEVGSQNVVQVITDNTAAYAIAGKLLEERFSNIFWTPCAAHCIDLILEDIGKISWVKKMMDNAKIITKSIYNDLWALNLMRQYTNGRGIVQSGVTQFATDFLTLESLHSERFGLKRMFVSEEWMESTFSTSEEGLLATKIIFDEGFWETLHEIIQVSEPLMKILHIVDNQDKSPMGYLYDAMNKAKWAIAEYYKNIEPKYRPFWELIDRRWSRELHKPIHAAAYYLNPKYFFDEAFVADEEILNDLYTCLERVVQDEQKINDIRRELQIYRNAEGCLFSSALCIRSRTTLNPAIWWDSFGVKTPLLQQVAIRILSQRCRSFACKRWSMFEYMHSKKCNELVQKRLNNLAYVHYNLVLQHKEIDEASDDAMGLLDKIDPTSDWITELEIRQPAAREDFLLTENQVAKELAAMEEEQVQVQTSPKIMKGNVKKRTHH